MRCQYCNCTESKVIDSRPTEEGNSIRRRRECVGCGRRFTTYEKIEQLPLMVVKRDGRREPFDATKVKGGILHACEKLPVSMQQIDAMTARIEQSAYAAMEGEIPSPLDLPPGCPFASRCEHCSENCLKNKPALKEIEHGHWVACHLF